MGNCKERGPKTISKATILFAFNDPENGYTNLAALLQKFYQK